MPIAELVCDQPEPIIVFVVPATPELMLEDGIHPSLAGQRATARALVERLTE